MQNNTTKMAKKTFIERALEQILADKDISRSHHLQLKKACESALSMYSIYWTDHYSYQLMELSIDKSVITLMAMRWINKIEFHVLFSFNGFLQVK